MTLIHQHYLLRSLKSRITRAHFAQMLYLDALDRTKLSKDADEKIAELQTLEFIEEGKNVIFSGVTGSQKTHMAIGIGLKTCQQGYRVLYTTVPNLILELREAKDADKVQKFTRRLNRLQSGRSSIFCMLSDESWETMNGKIAAAAVLYRKICEGAILYQPDPGLSHLVRYLHPSGEVLGFRDSVFVSPVPDFKIEKVQGTGQFGNQDV